MFLEYYWTTAISTNDIMKLLIILLFCVCHSSEIQANPKESSNDVSNIIIIIIISVQFL